MLGKLIGGGVGMMFGFPGLLIGVAAGHVYDIQRQEKQDFIQQAAQAGVNIGGNLDQVAFTVGVVILGAKMAKVDGHVSRSEIDTFKRVFNIPAQQEAQLARLFDQAKQDVAGYDSVASQLSRVFRNRPAVLEELLTGLMLIAAADGEGIGEAEDYFLRDVARIFGFGPYEFKLIAARSGAYAKAREEKAQQSQWQEHGQQQGQQGQWQGQQQNRRRAPPAEDDPYAILGVTKDTKPEDIKKAYRKLMVEHHPDKLVAAGMAPEFVAVATEKIKRINAAYETVCKLKDIK